MSSAKAQPQPQLPQLINLEGFECVARDGDFYFTAEEIGKQLGYAEPGDSVNKLYARNIQELQEYATTVKLTAVDGKLREHRVFSEEGVYIISFLAQTEQAAVFRRQVAALLKHLRRAALRKARAEGAADVLTLYPATMERMRKVLRYKAMGLSYEEMGKLLDCTKGSVAHAVAHARSLGLTEAS